MNRYVSILFIIIIFTSNAAYVTAYGSDAPEWNSLASVVIAFACLAIALTFIIAGEKK